MKFRQTLKALVATQEFQKAGYISIFLFGRGKTILPVSGRSLYTDLLKDRNVYISYPTTAE